ncbi:MAG: DUF488 domain-containing protein [Flavobacteriales bacterium]|nr:DUF488 domain-containing protein [Flavobacteriales bacterium]MCC6939654.1 DUF488 domain-containing protein [Flavobacteriales bacterium]
MYYRRRFILALLHAHGDTLDRLRLMKLLLLALRDRSETLYSFVPYKFGAYSFQATQDLGALVAHGYLGAVENQWQLKDATDQMAALSTDDRSRIARTVKQYASWSTRDIVHESYRLLPQTALRSEMAADLLSGAELQAVQATKPKPSAPGLYTIGYEGLDIDAFLNKLLGAGITLLCDVRRNAQSMKYGYSRKQLEKYCKSAGIRYLHRPALGIASEKRQELKGPEAYRKLFMEYAKRYLPEVVYEQENLLFDVQMEHRVAIMCFEADPDCCHRSHLADSLAGLSADKLPVHHL